MIKASVTKSVVIMPVSRWMALDFLVGVADGAVDVSAAAVPEEAEV